MSARNGAFDRFRGLAAVSVVMIHAQPFVHSDSPALRWLGWGLLEWNQCAVTFFFALSGWLLGSRWKEGRTEGAELGRSILRIAWLYIPWFAFYLLLDMVRGAPHDPTTVVRRFVCLADRTRWTNGYHLWFLPSLAAAQCICWGSMKFLGSIRPAAIAGTCLYLGLSAMDLSGARIPFNLEPHGLVNISLVCVAWGMHVGASQPRNTARKGRVWWILGPTILIEGAALNLIAGTPIAVHPFPISRVAFPVLVVSWLADTPEFLGKGFPGRLLDTIGRHSSAIYVMHLVVLVALPFHRILPEELLRDNLLQCMVAVVIPVFFSMVVRRNVRGTLTRMI